MNPLRELRSLVSSSRAAGSGVVVSVGDTFLMVRTRGGLKSFSTPSAKLFKPGDTVRFQGGVLLGKSVSADSIPVFKV